MEIYFVRHGEAGKRLSGAAALADYARELTKEGRKVSRRMAKVMRALGCRPSLVISSPLPRALQTAEIIAGIIGPGAPETRAFLSLSADPSAMFRRLRDAGDGPVLLVGHMPGLAMLAAAAVGGGAAAEFSKSGACRVDFDGAPAPGRGKLVWLLQPAQVKALRRAWKK